MKRKEKYCKVCGAKYILNPYWDIIGSKFPSNSKILEKMKYVPGCNCHEKIKEDEFEKIIERQEREGRRNRALKYRDISIFDQKFKESNFKNADMNTDHMDMCKKYATDILEGKTKRGLLLMGSVGAGKTYASACIANKLMHHGKSVFAIQFGLYLNKIEREWAAAENKMLKAVADCDLFIIDDCGVERNTEFAKEKLDMLIDARYRSKKPMIITSNLTLNEIEEKFGARVGDRLREMTLEIVVSGSSKRNSPPPQMFFGQETSSYCLAR